MQTSTTSRSTRFSSSTTIAGSSRLTAPPNHPPENLGTSAQADEANSRLPAEGREPRNRPLAPRRRSASMDHCPVRRSRSSESLCHFQLHPLRRASRQTPGTDRSPSPRPAWHALRPCRPVGRSPQRSNSLFTKKARSIRAFTWLAFEKARLARSCA